MLHNITRICNLNFVFQLEFPVYSICEIDKRHETKPVNKPYCFYDYGSAL